MRAPITHLSLAAGVCQHCVGCSYFGLWGGKRTSSWRLRQQNGCTEPEGAEFPYLLLNWQVSACQPQAIDAEALVKSGSCCLGEVRCLQN